ncbi:hypothetical protein D3C72_1093880 [compost metagenome]
MHLAPHRHIPLQFPAIRQILLRGHQSASDRYAKAHFADMPQSPNLNIRSLHRSASKVRPQQPCQQIGNRRAGPFFQHAVHRVVHALADGHWLGQPRHQRLVAHAQREPQGADAGRGFDVPGKFRQPVV